MSAIYDPQHKQYQQKVSNIQIDITKSYICFCFYFLPTFTLLTARTVLSGLVAIVRICPAMIYTMTTAHTASAVLDITVHGANVIGTPLIHIKYPYAAQQRQI